MYGTQNLDLDQYNISS